MVTVVFVIEQKTEYKVVYCCKWKQIFTGTVAIPCFIEKFNVLRVNITQVVCI